MVRMNGVRASTWVARLAMLALVALLTACGGGGGGGGADAGTPPPPPLGVTISGVSPAATLAGGSIKFTSAPTGGQPPYRYDWAFGDGGTLSGASAGAVADHVYASASPRYSILLTVTDAAGRTAQASTSVTVEDASGLNVVTTNGGVFSVGQQVALWPSSYPLTPVRYDWDLGDGRTAQGQDPKAVYTVKGQYTVALIATYENGIQRRASTTINVAVDAPTLSVSTPTTIYLDYATPVTFSPALETGDNVTLEVDGQPFAWFGSGISQAWFKKTGSYEVKATRRNSTGATAVATFSVTVKEPTPPSGLTLAVTQSTVKPGEASASVYLFATTGNDGTDPSNAISKFRWEFGDGTPDADNWSSVTHAFPAVGTYTVKVTGTNRYGLSSTATGTISVGPRQVLRQLAGESVTATRTDGPALQARFMAPDRLAFDAAGNLFIGDAGNAAVRKLTPQGTVSTIKLRFDHCGYWGDSVSAQLALHGAGSLDLFMNCGGLQRFDASGALLASDASAYAPVGSDLRISGMARAPDGALTFSGSHVLRRLETDGTVTYLAGVLDTSGGADGKGIAATFNGAYSIGYDAAGSLYVAEWYRIRKVGADGTVSTVAGRLENGLMHHATDGQGSAADFTYIRDIAVSADGTVHVLQQDGTIRRVSPAGVVTTLPAAADANLRAIAVAPDGTVVVADGYRHLILRVNADGSTTTLAGVPPAFARIDGAANDATFWGASGVAQGPSGALYVADGMNHALRKIAPDGQVTTLAVFSSNSVQVYGTTPFRRSIPRLGGVAVDDQENVYVADAFMNVIRKVAPDGTQTVLAGQEGSMGYANGTAAQARFYSPLGVAVDAARNVYVADFNHAIRKITPAGNVSTIAGVGGFANFQDGTGSSAYFNFPSHLTAAPDGTVYVSDYGNQRIRKITPAGEVSTVAGRSAYLCSAEGPLGTNCVEGPMGLALDPINGELYIAGYFGVLRLRGDGWLEKVIASDNLRRTQVGTLPANLNTVDGIAVLADRQLVMTSGNAVMATGFQP